MRTEEYFLKLRTRDLLFYPSLFRERKAFVILFSFSSFFSLVLAFADGKEKRTREECLDMIKSATKKNPNRNRNDNNNNKKNNNMGETLPSKES